MFFERESAWVVWMWLTGCLRGLWFGNAGKYMLNLGLTVRVWDVMMVVVVVVLWG
ncbi:hypothetical protein QBC41DRAFT_311929 [Cercophora samala]|uniref:Uncharacterized protein n=1 Tax=Cercophora samala TaxID=330535 RepID=A0AA40DFM9_9PEZI|nr:hypothetical protein QBC41DRAFT_311929 [Cercophora samala]